MKRKSNIGYYIKLILLGFGVIPFVVSLIAGIPFYTDSDGIDTIFTLPFFIVVFSAAAFLAVKCSVANMPGSFVKRYAPVCLPLLLNLAICALCMAVSKGFTGHVIFAVLFFYEIAFFPITLILALFNSFEYIFIIPFIYKAAFILFFTIQERKPRVDTPPVEDKPAPSKRFIAVFASLALICAATIGWVQFSRNRIVLPADYGFKYGGGFASVDIYRYDVNNNDNILPALNEPSSFRIGDRNKMPVMDGAEAAYPVYSAFANACYEGIADDSRYTIADDIEITDKKSAARPSIADEKITFTNTIHAFERLVNGDADIFFGAQPSKAQQDLADKAGKTLALTPIGKDAFVFFVNNTNICEGLTTQNIHDIYSGKVKNWSAITGRNENIYAFQRPEGSGSQTIMQTIMGDVPLATPLREEYTAGMGGVSERVANYRDYPGAIGYSFKFFTTEMAVENTDVIKLLTIDGVAPTAENIQTSIYPYTVSLYAITLADNKLDTIAPFLAWMQGAEGQDLIRKIGYTPIY